MTDENTTQLRQVLRTSRERARVLRQDLSERRRILQVLTVMSKVNVLICKAGWMPPDATHPQNPGTGNYVARPWGRRG